MSSYIIKLDDYYLEWSTVTDSPITFGLSLKQFKEYYRARYGEDGMRDLDRRLKRVEAKGTSALDRNGVDDVVSGNRAGPEEEELTKDEIYQAYCLQQPIRDGWLVPQA